MRERRSGGMSGPPTWASVSSTTRIGTEPRGQSGNAIDACRTTGSRRATEYMYRSRSAAPAAMTARRTTIFLTVLELFGQLRDDFEQVADEADVGDLEDRRFLVLV